MAGWRDTLAARPDLAPSLGLDDVLSWAGRLAQALEGSEQAAAQPAVRRMADGLARRSLALRAIGNGVHPLAAGYAWRAMYAWAIERQEISHNPAVGVAKIHQSRGGAKPWTAADLKKFREKHDRGSTAHLWLTLQMFTACRIGDAIWLGRECEVQRGAVTWLEWQPRKKGSAFVSIPMIAPLFAATRAVKVVGPTYLLTDHGKPFSSPESLRNRIQKWCASAGIVGKSSHGIRKAVAELLAESGCSQHQIMSIMAHSQAKTSEVYTKGAQRRSMAGDAMQALASLDW